MLQKIKHQFFTYRNGIIADTLRKSGDPHNTIFGLQLPQITDIANQLKATLSQEQIIELADLLWADRHVRESRLLACRLMPPESLDQEKALLWTKDVQTSEESDILAFALLRHTPHIPNLLRTLSDENNLPPQHLITALSRFSQ